MTSEFTDEKCKEFMDYNDNFGLEAEDVLYFKQGALPAIDFEGKIIREGKAKISLCPNGNGDIYRALKVTGMLQTLEERGINYVHLMGVDNMLCHVADPMFLGFTAEEQLDIGTKVIEKRPNESIGVMVLNNGKPAVIEYTELPSSLSHLTAGSILNHVYTLKSLKVICDDTSLNSKYHKAIKAIKTYDPASGTAAKPSAPNGVKFELFYFDAFFLCPKAGVLKVLAEEEFAPIKNPPGNPVDSPDMAKKLMTNRFCRWLEESGCIVEGDKETGLLEISAMVSGYGERLELYNGSRLKLPAYIFT